MRTYNIKNNFIIFLFFLIHITFDANKFYYAAK